MSGPAVGGRVLDVPALADAATGRTQYMRAVIYLAQVRGDTLAVPSAVRARVAAQVTAAADLAELDWFCGSGAVLEIPLAAADAGELDQLAKEHFGGEAAAAQAALIARRRGWPVITTQDRAPRFHAAGASTELLP